MTICRRLGGLRFSQVREKIAHFLEIVVNVNKGNLREALINSSFRAKRSVDPESSSLFSICYWMIRYAHPAGRPPGVQRAMRFCPAFAGMTKE
jgi:hypothetical protein